MKSNRDQVIKRCKEKLKELKVQYTTVLQRPTDNEKQGAEVIDMAFREQTLQDSSFFRERMRVLLPEIHSALDRISKGSYGLCEMTGEEIEDNRLLAVPWTRISIKALKQEAV